MKPEKNSSRNHTWVSTPGSKIAETSAGGSAWTPWPPCPPWTGSGKMASTECVECTHGPHGPHGLDGPDTCAARAAICAASAPGYPWLCWLCWLWLGMCMGPGVTTKRALCFACELCTDSSTWSWEAFDCTRCELASEFSLGWFWLWSAWDKERLRFSKVVSNVAISLASSGSLVGFVSRAPSPFAWRDSTSVARLVPVLPVISASAASTWETSMDSTCRDKETFKDVNSWVNFWMSLNSASGAFCAFSFSTSASFVESAKVAAKGVVLQTLLCSETSSSSRPSRLWRFPRRTHFCEVITVITSYSPISFVRYLHPVWLMCIGCIYDGSSKVLFPLLALNRNSMRDAFCFTCKKSYTEHTSKMQ